ncbi:hypothetical protein DFH09DRAFT_1309369 [Mycena vulgaris]|nr:hypothetical protein DFH09DRAFT_1309369 [Mycena vulgaris]
MATPVRRPRCPPPILPYVHDWAAPSITEPPVAPPTFNDHPARNPLHWHQLKFNPLGCYDLRRRLSIFNREPLIWNTYKSRFLASDIAWLASGASDDNQHHTGFSGFFPELSALRDSLPLDENGYAARREFAEAIRKLIWDLATMWDRTFGGSTTLILHASGTTIPGTPPRPEYLRASVLCRCLSSTSALQPSPPGWPLTQPAGTIRRNFIAADVLVPQPQTPGSSRYLFRGRPAGFVLMAAPTSDTPPLPTSTRYGSEEPLSPNSMEQISTLTAEVDALRVELETTTREHLEAMQHLTDMEREVSELMLQLTTAADCKEDSAEERRQLLARIAVLEQQGSTSRTFSPRPPTSCPPTYAASQMTPTRPRAAPPLSSPTKLLAEISLPSTTQLLQDHELMTHMGAIWVMVKHAAAAKWYQELAGLGVDADTVELLIDSLTRNSSM